MNNSNLESQPGCQDSQCKMVIMRSQGYATFKPSGFPGLSQSIFRSNTMDERNLASPTLQFATQAGWASGIQTTRLEQIMITTNTLNSFDNRCRTTGLEQIIINRLLAVSSLQNNTLDTNNCNESMKAWAGPMTHLEQVIMVIAMLLACGFRQRQMHAYICLCQNKQPCSLDPHCLTTHLEQIMITIRITPSAGFDLR